jgi:hypothetical protein
MHKTDRLWGGLDTILLSMIEPLWAFEDVIMGPLNRKSIQRMIVVKGAIFLRGH